MSWLPIIFGFVKDFLQGKREIKKLELEQKKETIIAETERIKANTKSDNDIDFLTNTQKSSTIKDDILIYTFLTPLITATFVPFVQAFTSSTFLEINTYILESYNNLNNLPQWYKYALILVIVDVLGFRSFFRNFLKNYQIKK